MRSLSFKISAWFFVLASCLCAVVVEAGEEGVRQFRGNATRTYYGSGPAPLDTPAVIWRFRTGQQFTPSLETPWEGLGWTGQPAVSVEGDSTFVYVGALDGHVYKLRFDDGTLVRKSPDNFYIIKSSPAITDRYVVVGAWDNAVHILDRRTLERIHSDTAIWTPSASYDFDSSPLIIDSLLYIGGEDGYVRKLLLRPPFPRLWHYPRRTPTSPYTYGDTDKPYVGIESSVAMAGDRLVVGTGSGKVWFLDPGSGRLMAEFLTGDDTDGTPVVDTADSSVYIGVECDFTERPGGLYKLGWDGSERWFFETGKKGIFSTPALDDERVFLTADDAWLYALDRRDGHLHWKTRLLDGSWSSPLVVDGLVIAADYAGALYGIDAATGAMRWRIRLGNYIVSSPVIWNGTILVGTRDGFVCALRAASNGPSAEAPTAK